MRYHEYMLKGDEGGQEYVNDAGERFWVDMTNFFEDGAKALYGNLRPVFRDEGNLDWDTSGVQKYKDSEGSIYYVDAFGGVTDETGHVYTIGFYDADAGRLFSDLVPVDEDDEGTKEPQGKVASDGGPSDYYDFPEGCETLNDLIEYKQMSFAQGNIFKAAYRLGNKEGITLEYDLKKIKYYADRMLNQLKKGKGID